MSTTIEQLTQRIELLEKQLTTLLKTEQSKEKPAKKEKKTKKEKDASSDDEKPKKKRTSGYILFSNANREDVKTKLMVGDEKPKNTEVMKELASMWKELNDEERGEWNAKAQKIKDEEDNQIHNLKVIKNY